MFKFYVSFLSFSSFNQTSEGHRNYNTGCLKKKNYKDFLEIVLHGVIKVHSIPIEVKLQNVPETAGVTKLNVSQNKSVQC